MLKRLLGIGCALLLLVSWATIQLPESRDAYCQSAIAAPFVMGHDVLVARTPEETLLWKKELIKSANCSIEFFAGFTGGPLLEETLLLFEVELARKPELTVHFFVASCPLFGWADQRKVELFAQRYPGRFHYLIRGMSALRCGMGLVTSENHIKLLIVDEKYLVVGGTNLFHCHSRSQVPKDLKWDGVVDHFNPKACMDMDMVIKGPIVSSLRTELFELWALYESCADLKDECRFEAEETRFFAVLPPEATVVQAFEENARVIRDVPVKAIVSGPRRSLGACSAEYARLVSEAQHSIDLMHMYISPVEEVHNSLIEASRRGVAITLITNGAGDACPMVTKAIGAYNRPNILPLLLGRKFRMNERAQAEASQALECTAYAYEVEDTLYHKKVMVLDDRISVIGSYNLGHKSHYGDYEIVVEVDSPELAQQIKQVMKQDIACAHLCSREELTEWYFGLGPRSLALLEGSLILGPLY